MKKTRRFRRLNRTAKRPVNGGKISGRGAYGCVVSPPIPCSTAPSPTESNIVVKLYAPSVNPRNVDRVDPAFPTEEIKAAEITRRIPSARTYFVVPFYHCDITTKNVETHLNAKECSETMSLYPIKLLWMDEADGDLWNAIFSTQLDLVPLPILAKAMKNLLIGIQILHSHKIIHRDIKLANILWKHANKDIWIKLADFGLSLFDPHDFEDLRISDLKQLAFVFSMFANKYGMTAVAPDLVKEFLSHMREGQSYEKLFAEYDAILTMI